MIIVVFNSTSKRRPLVHPSPGGLLFPGEKTTMRELEKTQDHVRAGAALQTKSNTFQHSPCVDDNIHNLTPGDDSCKKPYNDINLSCSTNYDWHRTRIPSPRRSRTRARHKILSPTHPPHPKKPPHLEPSFLNPCNRIHSIPTSYV